MIKGNKILQLDFLSDLIYTTCRIEVKGKPGFDDGVGTGFFYHFHKTSENEQDISIEAIVTNKHMVENAEWWKVSIHLKGNKDDVATEIFELTIADPEQKSVKHPTEDLCAIDFYRYLIEIEQNTQKKVYYQAFSFENILTDEELKTLFPITDVFMVGYPDGLWDIKNYLPITRRGVTASHPFFDFNGMPAGLVDIATFAGSSGSPIIMFQSGGIKYMKGKFGASGSLYTSEDKFALLGILAFGLYVDTAGEIVTATAAVRKLKIPMTQIMMHLGRYVKAKELHILEDLLIESNNP